MATTYELIIYGKVQHVGFRDRIESIGKGLGINGVIYNHKDGTVRILANFDDEEDKVSLFIEYIKRHKPENADVEKIEIEDYDGYVCSIDSYYKYLTALQLEKIATYGGLMLKLQKLTLEELEKNKWKSKYKDRWYWRKTIKTWKINYQKKK